VVVIAWKKDSGICILFLPALLAALAAVSIRHKQFIQLALQYNSNENTR
jgi:hypothetical protein